MRGKAPRHSKELIASLRRCVAADAGPSRAEAYAVPSTAAHAPPKFICGIPGWQRIAIRLSFSATRGAK